MKAKFMIFLIALLGCVTSCSKDKNNEMSTIKGDWNLIAISGAIPGDECNYPMDANVWTFGNEEVNVENNYIDITRHCAYLPGNSTKPYSVFKRDGNHFIIIDGEETGSFTLSADEMTIDFSIISTGSTTNNIRYRFTR